MPQSLLQLTHKYFGTGCIVTADGAFSPVRTLIALKQRDLSFMGLVKTTHKLISSIPRVWLNNWASGKYNGGGRPVRGSHVVLEATDTSGDKFYAVGWAENYCMQYW